MKIASRRDGGKLTISLTGDLDHHAAKKAIPEISKIIDFEFPTSLTLDFKNVSFMDSSGIALVIGSFKRARTIGCSFAVENVSKQANKVFDAAGIKKVIDITEEKILTR